jgi:hypothetical protein
MIASFKADFYGLFVGGFSFFQLTKSKVESILHNNSSRNSSANAHAKDDFSSPACCKSVHSTTSCFLRVLYFIEE